MIFQETVSASFLLISNRPDKSVLGPVTSKSRPFSMGEGNYGKFSCAASAIELRVHSRLIKK